MRSNPGWFLTMIVDCLIAPTARIMIAWGVAPGFSSGVNSAESATQAVATLNATSVHPMNRAFSAIDLRLRQPWGVAPGYYEAAPLAQHMRHRRSFGRFRQLIVGLAETDV